jgi:RND family efflux transporter MFP subunit
MKHLMIAAFLAPLIMMSGCGKKEPEKKPEQPVKHVRLQKLETGNSDFGKSFAATVAAKDTANVSFRVSGLLQSLPVNAGQFVEKDAVIAKLDPRDFQSAVNNVQGQLKEAQAHLQAMKKGAREEDIMRLKSGVAAAKAHFTEAKQKYDRNSDLYEKSVIAAQEFEEYKAALEVARSNLDAAEKELEIGQKGARAEDILAQESKIKSLQSNLKKSEDALKDTVLRAPFAGVIAQTYPNEHEDVTAGTAIARLQDISSVEIQVYVSENTISWISKQGNTIEDVRKSLDVATVSFPSIKDKSFPVEIIKYETDADPTTQTYEVTFLLEQGQDRSILPGMNGTLEIKAKADKLLSEDSFIVPAEAIFGDEKGNKMVWVVDPTTQEVNTRSVTVNQIVGQKVVISKGLKGGETIATTAANTLRKGMKVKELQDLKNL